VFSPGLFLVYVRNDAGTAKYVARHRIRKEIVPQHIIQEAFHYGFLGVSPAQVCNTQASMYLVMGRRDMAIAALRKGVEETGNPFLRNRLIQLMR
jgi:hypothetical protein